MARIKGHSWSETLKGGNDNDKMWGYGGHDTLYGKDGDDRIWGGYGDDRLEGQDGNDMLYGEAGDDELRGGKGADKLVGAGGNDVLYGGWGNDYMLGGSGGDVFHFEIEPWNEPGRDKIGDFNRNVDWIHLGEVLKFRDIDTNRDGELTNADAYVSKDGTKTVIDLGAAAGESWGQEVLTVESVSAANLREVDFLFGA